MVKNRVKFQISNDLLNSDKKVMSWDDFMETEIQDPQDKIVIDREEDF